MVLTKYDLSLPRTCEYYLHFDINLPYPEKELKNCIANLDKNASTQKENCQEIPRIQRWIQKNGFLNVQQTR